MMVERGLLCRVGTLSCDLGILLLSFNRGSKLSNPVTAMTFLSPFNSGGTEMWYCAPDTAEASNDDGRLGAKRIS